MMFVLLTDLHNLKVTEIHYHPLPEDAIDDHVFEFIELKNTGLSPLDLSGIRFCNGISFSFPIQTILNPDEFIVLSSNQSHFIRRYDFTPFSEYEGLLDNTGERIILINAVNDTLFSICYQDRTPWPVAADGKGNSLVSDLINPIGDQNNPTAWQASLNIHGSPGKDDNASTVIDEIQNLKHGSFQLS